SSRVTRGGGASGVGVNGISEWASAGQAWLCGALVLANGGAVEKGFDRPCWGGDAKPLVAAEDQPLKPIGVAGVVLVAGGTAGSGVLRWASFPMVARLPALSWMVARRSNRTVPGGRVATT